MSKKIFEEIIVASPLDIRHYVLDVPIVKKEFQMNAVKFALKSLYPGSEELTEFSFYNSQKKVIGIAASSEKIKNYKSTSKKILSPAKLINKLEQNAIAVYFSNEWIEIQVIKNKQTEEISTFSSYSVSAIKQKINSIKENSEYRNLPVKVYGFTSGRGMVDEIFTDSVVKITDVNKYINSSSVAYSEIFGKEKKNKLKFIFPVLFILLLIILGNKDYSAYKKYNASKEELTSAKNEYETAKKESEVVKEKQIQVAEKSINKSISVNYLLSEISRTAPNIRIISFSFNGKEFKLEAEKANAVKLIESLSNAEYISEVTMHHSLPQEDGTERFVISGSVEND